MICFGIGNRQLTIGTSILIWKDVILCILITQCLTFFFIWFYFENCYKFVLVNIFKDENILKSHLKKHEIIVSLSAVNKIINGPHAHNSSIKNTKRDSRLPVLVSLERKSKGMTLRLVLLWPKIRFEITCVVVMHLWSRFPDRYSFIP